MNLSSKGIFYDWVAMVAPCVDISQPCEDISQPCVDIFIFLDN